MKKPSKKIRVLVSAAGGSGTIEIIRRLREQGEHWVAAVDANRFAAGLYLADYGEVVPPVTHPAYYRRLGRIIRDFGIQVFVPLIDEELLPAYAFARRRKVVLILPREEFTRLTLDKYAMVQAFRSAGIRCPMTIRPSEITAKTFSRKLFVKPNTGRGSRGVMVIAGKKDLQQYFASQLYRPQDVILQEYIEGEEYTVSAVAGSRGDLYAVVPKRIIHKQGITYLSVTEKSSAIEKIVEKIQSVFKADGPFNVQLKMVRGQPCVLEVNPRFSTTVTHTMAAGVDEVTLLIKDFLGRSVGPWPKGFRDQLVMIRHLTQQYLPVGELK